MRLLILAFLCALFLSVTSCPPDPEEVANVIEPLYAKFNNDICGQGIKPGGQADVDFLNTVILPYYISKKWLTIDPPRGWEKDKDMIIAKCHKNTSNYCLEKDRKRFVDCFKRVTFTLVLKYAVKLGSYCQILDGKIANWDKDDKPQAMEFFTQYCATKGKKC
ncbi:hypothetical protein M413DRAFT_166653 [Hebeloma cylindrosporum]|uniref:Uncharacterized protein n=1 Tax=Hebeloma cylindrosporum TaxID=76867 RepID=A0A0C3BVR8_HEBCY|nr:hypothetical protein M413DRAFT_166653 [Hebeloma cylindrosporum h7]